MELVNRTKSGVCKISIVSKTEVSYSSVEQFLKTQRQKAKQLCHVFFGNAFELFERWYYLNTMTWRSKHYSMNCRLKFELIFFLLKRALHLPKVKGILSKPLK